jgi:large subunit ribosomal protein L3
MNALFGTKRSMTTRYSKDGKAKTITIVNIAPHVVVGRKTKDKHGYESVIMGIGKQKKSKKAIARAVSHLGFVPKVMREVRVESSLEAGESVKISDVLGSGDLVKVSGKAKGKGFTGVVKRHGFAGGPKTHGQSDRHRAPGSIGAGTDPGRVFKGTRMAGRSGGGNVCVRNLEVLYIDEVRGNVYLAGPVPGHLNSFLELTKIGSKTTPTEIEAIEMDRIAEEEIEEVMMQEKEVGSSEDMAEEEKLEGEEAEDMSEEEEQTSDDGKEVEKEVKEGK